MPDDIDLRSVNWSQGMFLTPDHFLRQERYTDSLLLWVVRHVMQGAGVLGGGARMEPAEYGAPRFDPIVEVDDSGDTLSIAVTQCRGIARNGMPVEVTPDHPLRATFPKAPYANASELGVYVLATPHDKEPDASFEDPLNPQLTVGRRQRYALLLEVAADQAASSVRAARLLRDEAGSRFHRDAAFIPPCVFMASHSGLMEGFRRLNERVFLIADRYARLHRAVAHFLTMAKSRGIDVRQDEEALGFVSRMVETIEACSYQLASPMQPPDQYFRELTRLIRSSALFLSLSPPTRQYFQYLGELGEAEFESLLRAEQDALAASRASTAVDDWSVEVRRAMEALDRLDRLEQALEGKYLDFRVSPSLESLNFVFDGTGGEPVLYKSVAKPTRGQRHGQDLTFVFAPLRLEARETYRLILVGERHASFKPGDRLSVELHFNPGRGYAEAPAYKVAEFEVDEQRNFAVDFKAPADLVTIEDLRVTLHGTEPIRSALLYVRARLLGGLREVDPGRPAVATPPRVTPRPAAYDAPPPAPAPRPEGGGVRRRRTMTEIDE